MSISAGEVQPESIQAARLWKQIIRAWSSTLQDPGGGGGGNCRKRCPGPSVLPATFSSEKETELTNLSAVLIYYALFNRVLDDLILVCFPWMPRKPGLLHHLPISPVDPNASLNLAFGKTVWLWQKWTQGCSSMDVLNSVLLKVRLTHMQFSLA